jgi:hypothetical protein
MTIVLEPQIEELLRRRATKEGKPVEAVVADLIVESLRNDSVVNRAIGILAADRLAREANGDFRSGGEILLAERHAESDERDQHLWRHQEQA